MNLTKETDGTVVGSIDQYDHYYLTLISPFFGGKSGIANWDSTAALTAGLIISPDSVSGWLAASYASEYSRPFSLCVKKFTSFTESIINWQKIKHVMTACISLYVNCVCINQACCVNNDASLVPRLRPITEEKGWWQWSDFLVVMNQ